MSFGCLLCVFVYKADGWFDLVVAVLFVAVVAPALCVCVCVGVSRIVRKLHAC